MTPNKKRAGLNPKQLQVLEQIRNLSDAEVAKGARVCKQVLGLRAAYPISDTSLDPDLFLVADIATKGWCDTTVKRYTAYFLGIAKKKNEHSSVARQRYCSVDHPFAPLIRGADGKVKPQWNGVFKVKSKPPIRFVSERLLLFLVLGLAIVKGTEKSKADKNGVRQKLWRSLGIKPATVVPISEDDDLLFWNAVTTPIPAPVDPRLIEAATKPPLFPTMSDVDAAISVFGGSPLNAPIETARQEEKLDGEDKLLKGLALLTEGIQEVVAQSRALRGSANLDLEERERALVKREHELNAREKAMREKEAVLAQVLRVTESLRGAGALS